MALPRQNIIHLIRPTRSVLLLLFVLSSYGAPTAAAREPTVADLIGLKNVSDVQLSPAGDAVAYVLSQADLDTNQYQRSVWVVAISGGEPRRLTISSEEMPGLAFNPALQWSPDGLSLSFIGQTSFGQQLFRIPRDGGDAIRISNSPTPVRAYRWAPDGSKVAWIAALPESAEVLAQIEESRWFRSSDRTERPGAIWIGSPGAPDVAPLTSAHDYVSGFDWSPDGKWLVYAAAAGPDFMSTYNTRLFVIAADGRSRRLLVDGPGLNASPRWSPLGDWIAYQTNWGDQTIMTNTGLAIVPAAGGEPRALTRERDRVVSGHEWNSDASALFVLASGGLDRTGPMRDAMFEGQLYQIGLGPASSVPGSISIRAVTEGRHQVYDLSLNRDRDTMAYKISDGSSMGDVFIRRLSDGLETRLTDLHPGLRDIDWHPVEPVSWQSEDGTELWGLLAGAGSTPLAGPLPLLVYVHGGPVGGFSYGIYPQFTHTMSQVGPYPVQALAAAGIAVFMPMPRGGNGYGSPGLKAIIGNWGVVDYGDIMAGVDALVERGIADPERLGVAGGSYGGYMTNWIVTQTSRFRAASSWAGICDLADLYALSDAGDFTLGYFGTPWDNPQAYRRHSPITYLSQMNTPLLLQHGEQDNRVPTSESIECHKILAAQGKPASLEIYPRAGHVAFEPRMQQRLQERNLQWFSQHLLDAE